MKGKILSSILALGASFVVFANGSHIATAPSYEPEYFNGWSVGIDGSMQHFTGDVSDSPYYVGEVSTTTTLIGSEVGQTMLEEFHRLGSTSVDADLGDITPGMGIFAGYGKVLNNSRVYLGGEVYGRYAHNTAELNSNQVSTYTTTPFDDLIYETGAFQEHTSINVKTDWSFGALVKLGYLVTPKTLIYALAGVENSRFKTEVSHSTGPIAFDGSTNAVDPINDSYSFDKNKWAFVPGVGIETMLTDKLSIKAEYTYAAYGDISEHHEGNVEGRTETLPYIIDINTKADTKVGDLSRGLFTLGLAWHFNGI